MAVNHVETADGRTLIDIRNSTITPETVSEGETAYNASGEKIIGTMKKNADYELCVNDVGGNVIERGTIVIDGKTFGIYEFYYKTGALPNAAVKTFPLANLLADYAIDTFVDATGVTSGGIFIGNGRTDNNNRLIVQQFSRNNKNFQIRAYQDFSTSTAILKIIFIGKKEVTT